MNDKLKYLGVLLGAILGGLTGGYIGNLQIAKYDCVDAQLIWRAYILDPMFGMIIGIIVSAIMIEWMWGNGFG